MRIRHPTKESGSIAGLRERRRTVEVDGLLDAGGLLDEGVVLVGVLGLVGKIGHVVPLDVEVSGVVVDIETDLLGKHLIGPEPVAAEVLVVLEDIELGVNGSEPVGDMPGMWKGVQMVFSSPFSVLYCSMQTLTRSCSTLRSVSIRK